MTPNEALVVTQAAIEAAADLDPDLFHTAPMGDQFRAIVEAFARFERDTIARTKAERGGEVVAWMYERKPDAWPPAPNVLHKFRWPEDDPARAFWTETPLYASPPAAEVAALREALERIKNETSRRQLPLTSLINDIARQALGEQP